MALFFQESVYFSCMKDEKYSSGLTAAIAASMIWGFLPIYWKLMQEVPAYEILAHRICWSFVFTAIIIFCTRCWQQLKQDCHDLCINHKRGLWMISEALLISINWLTYIWAVNNNHVLDTSIGYYINPLMNVLLGVIMFKERLSLTKWISVGLASAGIIIMAIQLGSLPWISIVLPITFALYGALKKMLQLGPYISIFLETLLLLPVSLLYIGFAAADGTSHFVISDAYTCGLLAFTGVVTAVPLVLFSAGANNLPLNVLGFMQYISPTMGFLLGIFYFGESFGMAQLFAFSFIWMALALFTVADFRELRKK